MFNLGRSYQTILALLLLAAITAQTFGKCIFVADYYANNDLYLKNCINKARPALHCNGKCQMVKKIQEQEKKEQDSLELKTGENNLYTPEPLRVLACAFSFKNIDHQQIAVLPRFSGVQPAFGIFRPPQA